MKNKRIITRIFSLILIIISLSAILVGTSSAYTADYSRPHSADKRTLNAVDIVRLITGETLSEIEIEYLTLKGDFSLSYITTIGTGSVSTTYDKYEKSLLVTAYEYSFTSAGGVTVVWKPVSVSLRDGESVPLIKNGEGYVKSFSDVEEGEDNSVSVIYSADFIIPKDVVNRLINLTYDEAEAHKKTIADKEREYNEALQQYNADVKRYEDYLIALSEYETLKSEYAAYLVALREYNEYVAEENEAYDVAIRIYNDDLSKYNAYKDDLAKYEIDLARYNTYVSDHEDYKIKYAEYLNYLKDKESFSDRLLAYESYLAKIDTVRSQIAILDAIKTSSTALKRTLYSAIMGSTVDSVLENRDVIANSATGVSPDIVDLAGDATENLRKHFNEYFSLKTEEEKYSYYILNYRSLASNFADLLRTLDRLYQSKQVCSELIRQEKHEKYVILLAQLYYITNALNDAPVSFYDPVPDSAYANNGVFDAKYRIWNTRYNKGGTSPIDALEGVALIEDRNNTTPLSGGYPAPVEKPVLVEVAEPIAPTPVSKPVRPTEVAEPIKPEAPVLLPPPTEVAEPTEPAEVLPAGEPPIPYEPTEEMKRLVSANIQKREPYSRAYVLSPEITVRKAFVNHDEVTVVFYNEDGEKLYMSVIDKGTYAEYVGEIPQKAETDTAKYVFLGWNDEIGADTPMDLSEINSDLQLYPVYKEIPKYKVSFIGDGDDVIYEKVVLAGESVSFVGSAPQRAETDTEKYVFIGWAFERDASEPISLDNVSSDMTLYPIYKTIQKHKVTFLDSEDNPICEVIVLDGEGAVYYGDTPEKAETPEFTFSFVGWTTEKGGNIEADLTDVRDDLTLYPIFDFSYKYYEITFIVDSEKLSLDVRYGDIPEYPEIPSMSDTLSTYYVFVGWDKEIIPVEGDCVYTAVFEERYVIPYSEGGGGIISLSDSRLIADCSDSNDAVIEVGMLLERAAKVGSVAILLHGGERIEIGYSDVLLLNEIGAKTLSFSSVMGENHSYTYRLSILNNEGNEIATNLSALVKAPCEASDFDHLFLYSEKNLVWERVNFSHSDGYVVFNTGGAVSFKLRSEYAVSIIGSGDKVVLSSDRTVYSPGETVTLTVSAEEGISVINLYYIGTDGIRVNVADGEFVMPADTVSVGVEYELISYTVKFILDDGVELSYPYHYGEMPVIPASPMKADMVIDGVKYTYTFVSWSEEVLPVTGDVTYTAVFTSEIVPERDKSGLQISDGVLKILVPVAALGLIFVTAVLPVFVLWLVFTFSGAGKISKKIKKNAKK